MELPWEDYLLERKTEGDLRDLLKTMVAFANSVRPEHKAVILIGEKDDGTIKGVTNPDNIQKKIREEADKIYPAIIWRSEVYEKEGVYCVRVEIEYSGNTPHFGGTAWVRRGSETIKAPDEVFQSLIDLRSSKVRELMKWVGKTITIHADKSNVPPDKKSFFGGIEVFSHRWGYNDIGLVLSVNNFWITTKRLNNDNDVEVFPEVKDEILSEPLEKLLLSFDGENKRLKIIVNY